MRKMNKKQWAFAIAFSVGTGFVLDPMPLAEGMLIGVILGAIAGLVLLPLLEDENNEK